MLFYQKNKEFSERPMPSLAKSYRPLAVLIFIALILTSIQVAIALTQSSGSTLSKRYLALRNWDALAYERIASVGYTGDEKNPSLDAVWFPGHSFVIRAVHALSGRSWQFSTVAASQIANVFFWTYFLLFLRRLKSSFFLSALSVAFVLFYPSSFFFVNGYSESLFMAAILGMLYWMGDDRTYAWIIATMFAFIASTTRITAIAFIPIPLIYGIYNKRIITSLYQSIALGSGSLLLFSYYWLKFNDFFLYYHRSHQGWGTSPIGLMDLKWSFLWFREPLMGLITKVIGGDGFSLSAFMFVIVTNGVLLLIGTDLIAALTLRRKSIMHRLVFYIGAITTLYLGFTAQYTIHIPGMTRYMLPTIILSVLALMHFLSSYNDKKIFSYCCELVMPAVVIFFIPLHWMYVHHYVMSWGWVY